MAMNSVIRFAQYIAFVFITFFALSSCTQTVAKLRWDKPGTPEEQAKIDAVSCGVEIKHDGAAYIHERDLPAADKCMRDKGYETNPD